MRDLHGYHGEHRRHVPDVRDAHTPVDNSKRDTAKRAAWNALILKMLWGPETRKRESLKAQRNADAAEASYAARHAKPKGQDQGESKPKHVPLEHHDKPASKIDERTKSPKRQERKQERSERSTPPTVFLLPCPHPHAPRPQVPA